MFSVMSGHGTNSIFFNKKIKIEHPGHSLTPKSLSPITSFFCLTLPPPSKWTTYVYHSLVYWQAIMAKCFMISNVKPLNEPVEVSLKPKRGQETNISMVTTYQHIKIIFLDFLLVVILEIPLFYLRTSKSLKSLYS